MREFHFFEKEDTPAHIHVGLRMIKTVIAVFLCSIIGWLRGQPAFFAMIAAVVCTQNTPGKTVVTSLNQLLGTVIGALFGLGALYLELLLGLQDMMPVYYLLVSVLLIPIIVLTLLIRKPSISAFSCVVFLSVAVFQLGTAQPWVYALQRGFDVFVGVLMAFLVNLALPQHTGGDETKG